MNISKTRYLQIFLSVTIVLALVRCVCPQIAGHSKDLAVADSLSTATDSLAPDDSVYHGNGVAAMLGESHPECPSIVNQIKQNILGLIYAQNSVICGISGKKS